MRLQARLAAARPRAVALRRLVWAEIDTWQHQFVRRPSVVPDTNVWRYIVDTDALETVRKAAKAAGVDLVACPAVLYECLRTPDRRLRLELAKALTRQAWVRPMPEAFVESQDLRFEIARLRPHWIVPAPALREWWALRSDWEQGTWWRARHRTDLMARAIDAGRPDLLTIARVQAAERRRQAQELGQSVGTLRLNRAMAWYLTDVPGWDGEMFEAWRGLAQDQWWHDLIAAPTGAMHDWLAPWLDLSYIRTHRSDWVSFWTREVEKGNLPRDWIRWAMTEVQAVKKVTPGTPVDNQIATYLFDFDMFVTGDRAFIDCVEAIRPHAPRALAETSVLPAGAAAVDRLLEVIDSLITGSTNHAHGPGK